MRLSKIPVNIQLIAFATILFTILLIPTSFAADPTIAVDKTVTPTGPDTATVTLEVTGTGDAQTNSADVVFAIDSSGSMFTNDPSGLRLTASDNFVDQMNPTKDQAGVVSWDDDIDFTQPLTNDFTLVKSQINSIDSSGGTDLDVGLQAANNLLDTGGRAGSSHVIIFLTDGDGVYTAHGSPGSQADYAASKGYIIYTVGLGSGVIVSNLQDIASTTGGKYYFAADASALDQIFNDIFKQINTAGTNVVATDILPSYIELVGDPTIPLTSKTVNPDGTTTLTWNIGTLVIGQTWTTSFNIRSTEIGLLPTNVYPDSGVTYTDIRQNSRFVEFPEVEVNFVGQTTARTDNTVETVNAAPNTIPMQSTGVPVVLLLAGLVAVIGGAIYPRTK
jgi:Ca-activated chloride channel family protein